MTKPATKSQSEQTSRPQLPKAPAGIQGLDEITGDLSNTGHMLIGSDLLPRK
jgi:circadian clock protein KaiB